ncbi:MAG: hypothetical protein J7647_21175 [Cyanobacteria bacterium SBLK]|nr:hypothetical protein [Cyanobacteria bacterium SBLK]
MAVMVVLLLVGTLVSPANAAQLRCERPETYMTMTLEPYTSELTPATTKKLLFSVMAGEGKYLYDGGAQLPIFANIGSIIPGGPHYIETPSSFGRGRILNLGEGPLEIELCYVLVQ